MPRKASQAAKKDSAAAESKSEGATRRSGRAAAKQDTATSKEASRSRRSSTAAQTAASVADSKTPKKTGSSRRDSTSPSEGRQKSRRESVESPATRVKSTRRASGRVNYKESDGEEENTAPKYDENFESNEEEESDTEDKSKSKAKGKAPKSSPKGRSSRDKGRASSSRRGRPKKQSSDEEEEEEEPIELSEESSDIPDKKKAKEVPVKESPRGGRTRKSRGEVKANVEEKPKSSRRSARSSASKEETPAKKRPTRGVQAKKYAEEEDDIEEIEDTKDDEKMQEGSRKRKRGSTTESNKRLKEESEERNKEKIEIDISEDTADKDDEQAAKVEETENKEESSEEPMEVDASASEEKDNKEVSEKNEESESKSEPVQEEKKESKPSVESDSAKVNVSEEKNKPEDVDIAENLDESMQSYDSDQGSRAEQSISSSLEDSQDTKETKAAENKVSNQEESFSGNTKSQVDYHADSSNSYQDLDDNSESKSLSETDKIDEQKQEISNKTEPESESEIHNVSDGYQNDIKNSEENESQELKESSVPPPVSSIPVAHSKETNFEPSLNGAEPIQNSTHIIQGTPDTNLHPEDTTPKANGAHDLHNSVPESNQYYQLPGRKYVINSKLGESIRESVKDKSFGFVSYNLGISSSDSSIQKEKLLNELNKLDAHIICMQQVSKSFYSGILEPSLDALGFKGTFSQPEDSEKGMATFYKSSLFRLSGQSEASLKQLIEKELEYTSLDIQDRLAVKSHIKKCGHVLLTHFATVIGMHSLTVANVQVPPTDLSIHSLQVSCLVREVIKINGGTSRPFLLGGEFNMVETEAPYQLLRDGYLSNDMIEELQKRKDVALPGKENAALVNLLWSSFQHPSSTLCSCYKSVLDHEVFIPDSKVTSPDLLWYSSDSLYTVGVLDASETVGDRHFSLKADVAFSV